MFAVVKIGGKQYKVCEGDLVKVEKISLEKGDSCTFDQVLMIENGKDTVTGKPFVSGATVTATIEEQGKARTILVFKKRRRKHFRRKNGHRQRFTVLKVSKINIGA